MDELKKPTVMRFRLTVDRPMDPFHVFFPKGHHLLNRTEWRGKEPRSCAVTGLHGHEYSAGDKGPIVFDVEVSYRPKGFISFVGTTKYDGWTAMMLDKRKDGTLLDGKGSPLPPGEAPVYLPFEVYDDAEFNEMNFGDFVEEVEVGGIKHVAHDDLMRQVFDVGFRSFSVASAFIAPRRQRPLARIVISELQLASAGPQSDMRVFHIDKNASHFRQSLLDLLYEVASGFIEGRYSIKTLRTKELEFVEFSDCIMELRIQAGAEEAESVFDVFSTYVSSHDMEELCKRLMAVYEVDITIVDGNEGGFLIKRDDRK